MRTVTMTNTIELLIHEALGYEAEAFDKDDPVNAADLVEWFAAWRDRAKSAVRTVDWSGKTPAPVTPICGADIDPFKFKEVPAGES
jgi:hypothetical protein